MNPPALFPRAIAAVALTACALTSQLAFAGETTPGQSFTVGANPAAIALDIASHKLYVANSGDNTVTVIDTWGNTKKIIPVGLQPTWVAINTENNTVYVGNKTSNNVTIIDGATDTVSGATTSGGAGWMAVNPLVDRVFAARFGSEDKVDVIEGEHFSVTSSMRSRGPVALALNPVNNWLYVANPLSGDVAAMDMTTPQAFPPLKCPDGSGGFRAQPPAPATPDTYNTPCIDVPDTPVGVAVNPVTNKIYALSNAASNQVSVINGADSTFTSLTPPGSVGTARAIAVNPLNNTIWAAFSAAVVKIDGATNAMTVFPAGSSSGGPVAIGIDVTRNMVYVVGDNGTLLAINATAGTTETLALEPGANGIALDPTSKHFFVLSPSRVTEISGNTGTGVIYNTKITTTITPLPNNIGGSSGSFEIKSASGWPAPLDKVRKVFYRLDQDNTEKEATPTGPGTWRVDYSGLAPGIHNLYVFGINGLEAPSINTDRTTVPITGNLTSYQFTVPGATARDLSVTQTVSMNPAPAGKDVVYTITVTNNSPGSATGIVLTDDPRASGNSPYGVTFVWASDPCKVSYATGMFTPVVKCNFASLAGGASVQVKVVLRLDIGDSGWIINNVSVRGNEPDPYEDNDYGYINTTIMASRNGVPVPRYRLYSPGTQEHLYTTDKNEYDTLGQSGAWNKEGEAGKILDNPGTYNGLRAMPYYRLYNTENHWHHWTTDANEYYTLIQFPQFNAEGVDGYILPSNQTTPGTVPLYRLLYPDGRGLHLWTIDANEADTLSSQYGWIKEGGTGYVIK